MTRTLFAAALALPLAAQAHTAWLLPSATVLPLKAWVTVDAGISTDAFIANHNPLRLDTLVITAPDGSTVQPENALTGKFRSTFDVNLAVPGTYRLSLLNSGLNASYELGGERKRWRGKAENLTKEIPAEASKLEVGETLGRVETFVTNGAKSLDALKPTGKGLELVPVTHPTDLFVGETATFKLLIDGAPAAAQKLSVVRGGMRYRNQQNEIETTTDSTGAFRITWPEAGPYLLSASATDDKVTAKPATQRRLSYTASFEVLPQ
ncbi:MAG: DUF4198 domain-containing protein [Pseudomonadota bacterium]